MTTGLNFGPVNQSLPPSTRIINRVGEVAQDPTTQVNPESVNNRVDQAVDRVNELQQSRESAQTDRRAATAQVVENQTQQANLERFIEASSGTDVDSSSPTPESVLEFAENLRQLERRDALSNNEPGRNEAERPQFNNTNDSGTTRLIDEQV